MLSLHSTSILTGNEWVIPAEVYALIVSYKSNKAEVSIEINYVSTKTSLAMYATPVDVIVNEALVTGQPALNDDTI